MKSKSIIWIISLAVVFVVLITALGSGISIYNRTITRQETIQTKEAEVKNRLLQRHDKMNQIISAVQGLEQHAEDLLSLITQAREAYNNAKTVSEFAEADAMEAQALSNLLVVIEDNPNISAESAYYTYINEVSAMENALAVARRDYNNAVLSYNTSVKKFPAVLYMGIFKFETKYEYWKTDSGSLDVPIVDFTK